MANKKEENLTVYNYEFILQKRIENLTTSLLFAIFKDTADENFICLI